MLNRFLIFLISCLLQTSLHSQSLVFTEDFDSPPLNVNCYSLGGITGSLGTVVPPNFWCWNPSTTTAASGNKSYHAETPFSSDTVIFESNSFSTIGNTYVRLTFKHKALLFGTMKGEIQVSNNNGSSWISLGSSEYLGQSSSFPVFELFNINSYTSNPLTWGTPTNPLSAASALWVTEEFELSSILGGTNGYANCKVRFIYKSNQGNLIPSVYWNQYEGWFIDDIEVEAAACEFSLPSASFNLNPTPVPGYVNEPLGPVLSLQPKFGIDTSDPSGIQEVRLKYQINGGPQQTAVMNAHSNISHRYEHQFSPGTLVLCDTVSYFIEVEDASCMSHIVRLPSNPAVNNVFWIRYMHVSCGTSLSGGFPEVIDQFPWFEDFEGPRWVAGSGSGNSGVSHRGVFPTFPSGNWHVAPNPIFTGWGWSIRQGAPASSQTGPYGDHGSGNGNFIYYESSQTGNPPNSQLITPCIDLTAMTGCITFEFWYHRFGNQMQELRLDIDTGSSANWWYQNFHSIPGSTQGSQTDPWLKAVVDLSAFQGKIIRLRFVGSHQNDLTDMAIDDLRIYSSNNALPSSSIAVSDSLVCRSTPIVFNADSGEACVDYQWFFGNSASLDSASGIGPHIVSFNGLGQQTVQLSAISAAGQTSTQVVLEVEDSATASFQYTSGNPTYLDYQFTNTSITSGNAIYNWDFGDGTSSNASNPQHSFSSSGTFIVRLTVSNVCGTVSHVDTIQINSIGSVETLTHHGLVFPNPLAREQYLFLKSDVPIEQVDVYTIHGQEVYSAHYNNGQYELQLDLNQLASGLYILRANTALGTFDQKVILE